MSVAAALAMIYGIKRLAEHGWHWLPAVSILAGLMVGALFARRQRRLADPLIDVALIRPPAFAATIASPLALVIAGSLFSLGLTPVVSLTTDLLSASISAVMLILACIVAVAALRHVKTAQR